MAPASRYRCAGVRVEAQRAAEGVDHLGRGTAFASLFQAGVVVGVHSGQDGDLLAAQSGDSAGPMARHTDVLRLKAGSACAQEVSQEVVVHAFRLGGGRMCCLGVLHPGSTRPG